MFKVGDEVICIQPDSGINVGQRYKVTKDEYNLTFTTKTAVGIGAGTDYFADHFILASQYITTPVPGSSVAPVVYKPGDFVELITDSVYTSGTIPAGTILKVTSVGTTFSFGHYIEVDSNGLGLGLPSVYLSYNQVKPYVNHYNAIMNGAIAVTGNLSLPAGTSGQIFYQGINGAGSWIDTADNTLQISTTPKSCIHEFVNYHGFSEVYQYCKKCDYKLK